MIDTNTNILDSRERIMAEAVNEITAEKPGMINSDLSQYLYLVNLRILDKMVDYFPTMCLDMWTINNTKKKLYSDYGNKGKYTDSVGWSKDGNFFDDYTILPELYHFMTVGVYKDFWGNDNEKIWRKFLSKICDGIGPMTDYDAKQLLMKIMMYYGGNKDGSLT